MMCSYLGLMKSQNQEEQVLEEENSKEERQEPRRRFAVAWTLTKAHITSCGTRYFFFHSYYLFLSFQEVPLAL